MKKYYRPSADEFCIGFEYEYIIMRELQGEWIPATITMKNWNMNMDTIHVLQRTRVKCLDEDDIESLGWKRGEPIPLFKISEDGPILQGDTVTNILTATPFNRYGRGFKKNFGLYLWSDGKIKIFYTNDGGVKITVFDGLAKNKTELKKIMKQTFNAYDSERIY